MTYTDQEYFSIWFGYCTICFRLLGLLVVRPKRHTSQSLQIVEGKKQKQKNIRLNRDTYSNQTPHSRAGARRKWRDALLAISTASANTRRLENHAVVIHTNLL